MECAAIIVAYLYAGPALRCASNCAVNPHRPQSRSVLEQPQPTFSID